MPIEAKLTYRKHPWVPAVASGLGLLGGILWVVAWPGWVATVAVLVLHISIVLLWWQAKSMEAHWRTQLEKQIAETIGNEIRAANPALFKLNERTPSQDLAKAIKDITG